ncbi:NUDIX hydrolase [Patescibacteria group bacterium]
MIVVALSDKNEIILKREYRPGVQKMVFELPAGYIEKGETPRQAALSELQDEMGYKSRKIQKVGELYRSPKRLTQVTTVFLAKDLKWKGQNLEADEHGIEISFVPYKKVVKMIKDGEIKDMATIAAIMMAMSKLVL